MYFIFVLMLPPVGGFLKDIRKITKKKKCTEIGRFDCKGYDTYTFNSFVGITKGRPNDKDIAKTIKFYNELK